MSETSPRSFFMDEVRAWFEGEPSTHFERFSTVPVVISFLVEGAGRWTAVIAPDHIEVVEGEREETPLLTLITPLEDWPLTLPRLRKWLKRLAERLPTWGREAWGAEKLEKISKVNGSVRLLATEHATDDGPRDLEAHAVIGAYTPRGGSVMTVTITSENYDALLEGRLRPVKAFGDGRLRISGGVALGLKLWIAAR